MSVTVPTASGTGQPRTPHPTEDRHRRRVWWALVSVAVLVLAFCDRDPASQELVTDEVEPPSATFPASPEPPLTVIPALRSETFFPGQGTFTAHAGSIHGQVAVGQRADTPGAFVHTTDPAGEMWTAGSIEVSERAWVGDVSAWEDVFIIGGAIAGPGMGSSVPTLWSGTVAGEFRVVEHPFAGPGRVDRIRVVGGEMFVMGQGAAPFTDTLATGSARFGRLLVGRPGAWSEITPHGYNVIVNDVVGYGDGLVAVGGDIDGAVLWWLASGSDEWVTIPLGDGVATGASMTVEAGLVVSVLHLSADGETRSGLLAGSSPRSLMAMGTPLRVAIGEIEPYDGGVIGTSVADKDGTGLWWYRFGEGWSEIGVGTVVGVDRAVLDATVSPDLVAFGSAADQPALWSGGLTEPQVLASSTDPQWEFVSLLPGDANQMLDTGTHLFAYRNALDAETVWVSSNRSRWQGIETADGFGLAGATGSDSGWVMFGETDEAGVLYTASESEPLSVHVVPGASIHHAARSGNVLTVLATTASGPVRLEFIDGLESRRTPLSHLPARVIDVGSRLVGGEFGSGGVSLSTDGGTQWEPLFGTYVAVGTSGGRLLLVSDEGVVSVLVPGSVDPMPLADVDPGRSIVWAGGVLEDTGSQLRLVALPDAGAVGVRVGVDAGINGVFERAVPGPGGYALVTERGVPALYRWMGVPP